MKIQNKASEPLQLNYDIGKTISRLRKDNGWSQEHFSDLCGIERAHLGKCELGLHSLTIRNLNKIVNVLGYTMSAFFQEVEKTSTKG